MKNKSNSNKKNKANNANNEKGRFSGLKEYQNPFKKITKQPQTQTQPQSQPQTQPEPQPQPQTQPQPQPQLQTQTEKAYIPVSKRNKNKETKQINSPKLNIFTLKSPKIENIKTDDMTLFPSLNSETEITKPKHGVEQSLQNTTQNTTQNNTIQSHTQIPRVGRVPHLTSCWNKTNKLIKSDNRENQTVSISKEPIKPGWIRITKTKNISGPPSETSHKHKYTYEYIRYLDMLKRHKQNVMDDLELYGDEYYYKFGDPEELLIDEDIYGLNDDEGSTNDDSSCEDDRDSYSDY